MFILFFIINGKVQDIIISVTICCSGLFITRRKGRVPREKGASIRPAVCKNERRVIPILRTNQARYKIVITNIINLIYRNL